jgi:hypothetical protein
MLFLGKIFSYVFKDLVKLGLKFNVGSSKTSKSHLMSGEGVFAVVVPLIDLLLASF